jgi:circadian clock protein KaiC
MFGGGIPEGSATIFQGGTGTGKTLLGLQFLSEGARQGKRGVLFTLEETPEQLRAAARNVGLDLEAYERDGLISLEYFSPVELSPDRYLDYARRRMSDPRVSRVVLDSLSTLALGVTSERRFKELAYTLAKHARKHRITFAMTMETEQLLGTAQLSAHGVSFISDNLVQLRYVEVKGRLTRGISVLKARGIQHDTDVRAFIVASTGLEVRAQDFENLRDVLTGRPVEDS